MALEPWLVEAVLARLLQVLNPEEQRTIVNATRTPHKVKWPAWWSEHPTSRGRFDLFRRVTLVSI
jgi:hypothetical protein